jgi:hypothetical protein
MTTKAELVAALERNGWVPDANGRYIRGESFVKVGTGTLVQFYDGSPVGIDDDTMGSNGGTMNFEKALAWVLKKSSTP